MPNSVSPVSDTGEDGAAGNAVEDVTEHNLGTSTVGRNRNDRLLIAVGHRMARVEQLNRSVTKAFNSYWLARVNDELELNKLDEERQIRNERLIDWCRLECPALQNVIDESVQGDFERIEGYFKKIDSGRIEAKNNDTSKLKKWVATPDILDLSPPIKSKAMDDRGFRHEQLGEMLCPIGVNWHDKAVRLNMQMPGAAVSHKAVPRILYPDLEGDPDDIEEGLFRNPLYIKAFKLLIVDSQQDENMTLAERIARSLTPHAFAYTAMQFRFALCSDHRIDTKVFDYTGFYNFMFELMTDESGEAFFNELKEFYTSELDTESDDNVIGQDTTSGDSTIKRLRRQRARKALRKQREELARLKKTDAASTTTNSGRSHPEQESRTRAPQAVTSDSGQTVPPPPLTSKGGAPSAPSQSSRPHASSTSKVADRAISPSTQTDVVTGKRMADGDNNTNPAKKAKGNAPLKNITNSEPTRAPRATRNKNSVHG